MIMAEAIIAIAEIIVISHISVISLPRLHQLNYNFLTFQFSTVSDFLDSWIGTITVSI